MSKKKALLILAAVFGVLTFCGAAYVWLGNANDLHSYFFRRIQPRKE